MNAENRQYSLGLRIEVTGQKRESGHGELMYCQDTLNLSRCPCVGLGAVVVASSDSNGGEASRSFAAANVRLASPRC